LVIPEAKVTGDTPLYFANAFAFLKREISPISEMSLAAVRV